MLRPKIISLLCGLLAAISLLSGILMSRPSFIGRAGIRFFYQQYAFLRTWWQGALVVFFSLMLLVLILALVHYRFPRTVARIVSLVFILFALVGAYLTYRDFHQSVTHRWLGARFHTGAYLFWVGWVTGPVFFLVHTIQKEIKPEV